MEKGRIGLNAGKVWHALNEVNEISTQELSRTDLLLRSLQGS